MTHVMNLYLNKSHNLPLTLTKERFADCGTLSASLLLISQVLQ